MKNITRNLIKKDADYEFEVLIKEVEKKEDLKAKAFSNRSTYINPCKLRIGIISDYKKAYRVLPNRDYCPV